MNSKVLTAEEYIAQTIKRSRLIISSGIILLVISTLCLWYLGYAADNPKSMANSYKKAAEAHEVFIQGLNSLEAKTDLEKKLILELKDSSNDVITLAYFLWQWIVLFFAGMLGLPLIAGIGSSFNRLHVVKKIAKLTGITYENH